MVCQKCLTLITELERLERIHAESREALRNRGATAIAQHEINEFWVAEYGAKLDMVIARLELRRHQRTHVGRNAQAA